MRDLRRRAESRETSPISLRELYRTLELPGANRLNDAQAALDRAVREAYRWGFPAIFAISNRYRSSSRSTSGAPRRCCGR